MNQARHCDRTNASSIPRSVVILLVLHQYFKPHDVACLGLYGRGGLSTTCEDTNRQEHHQDDEGQGCHLPHFFRLPTPPEGHPVDLHSSFQVMMGAPGIQQSTGHPPEHIHQRLGHCRAHAFPSPLHFGPQCESCYEPVEAADVHGPL